MCSSRDNKVGLKSSSMVKKETTAKGKSILFKNIKLSNF